MTKWTYKVYRFSLHEGRSQPMAQALTENRSRLFEALEAIGRETRIGKPTPPANEDEGANDEIIASDGQQDGEFQQTRKTLNVRHVSEYENMSIIHLSAALGEQGLHDFAIDPDGKEEGINVANRAAETPRKVDFYFASSGNEGIIVSEVVGAGDAVPAISKWLYHLSLSQRRMELSKIKNGEIVSKDSAGKSMSKTAAMNQVPKTLRMKFSVISDPDFVDTIISDIKTMKVDYIQRGQDNRVIDKRLEVNVKQKEARSAIISLFNNNNVPSVVIASALEENGLSEEDLNSGHFNPNATKARITSPHGNTTMVPGKISDLFNYPFSMPGVPSCSAYYEETIGKAEYLKLGAGIPIQFPEWADLAEQVESEDGQWFRQERKN